MREVLARQHVAQAMDDFRVAVKGGEGHVSDYHDAEVERAGDGVAADGHKKRSRH